MINGIIQKIKKKKNELGNLILNQVGIKVGNYQENSTLFDVQLNEDECEKEYYEIGTSTDSFTNSSNHKFVKINDWIIFGFFAFENKGSYNNFIRINIKTNEVKWMKNFSFPTNVNPRFDQLISINDELYVFHSAKIGPNDATQAIYCYKYNFETDNWELKINNLSCPNLIGIFNDKNNIFFVFAASSVHISAITIKKLDINTGGLEDIEFATDKIIYNSTLTRVGYSNYNIKFGIVKNNTVAFMIECVTSNSASPYSWTSYVLFFNYDKQYISWTAFNTGTSNNLDNGIIGDNEGTLFLYGYYYTSETSSAHYSSIYRPTFINDKLEANYSFSASNNSSFDPIRGYRCIVLDDGRILYGISIQKSKTEKGSTIRIYGTLLNVYPVGYFYANIDKQKKIYLKKGQKVIGLINPTYLYTERDVKTIRPQKGFPNVYEIEEDGLYRLVDDYSIQIYE